MTWSPTRARNVRGHALQRLREHWPGANHHALLVMLEQAEPISEEVVNALLVRTKDRERSGKHYLTTDRRGIFVTEGAWVTTYLRLGREQQKLLLRNELEGTTEKQDYEEQHRVRAQRRHMVRMENAKAQVLADFRAPGGATVSFTKTARKNDAHEVILRGKPFHEGGSVTYTHNGVRVFAYQESSLNYRVRMG